MRNPSFPFWRHHLVVTLLRAPTTRSGWVYRFILPPRTNPARVSPERSASSTASELGAETAISIGMPASTAFWVSSNEARPDTTRARSRAGTRPDPGWRVEAEVEGGRAAMAGDVRHAPPPPGTPADWSVPGPPRRGVVDLQSLNAAGALTARPLTASDYATFTTPTPEAVPEPRVAPAPPPVPATPVPAAPS